MFFTKLHTISTFPTDTLQLISDKNYGRTGETKNLPLVLPFFLLIKYQKEIQDGNRY